MEPACYVYAEGLAVLDLYCYLCIYSLSVGCFLDICIDTCVSSLLGTVIHLSCIPVTTHKVHTSACCMRIDMFLSQDLVPPN